MHIDMPSTATATAPAPLLPGALVATAALPARGQAGVNRVDVIAGRVLATGVTDIREAAGILQRATHGPGFPGADHTWGLVGFVRTGDAWSAVELLAPSPSGPRQIHTPYGIREFHPADGITLDAIWNIQHFGGDTMWGTPESIIRPAD